MIRAPSGNQIRKRIPAPGRVSTRNAAVIVHDALDRGQSETVSPVGLVVKKGSKMRVRGAVDHHPTAARHPSIAAPDTGRRR